MTYGGEIENNEKTPWQKAAATYADTTGRISALSGQAEIAIEIGAVDENCTVLDLGCGPGQLSAAIAPFAGEVIGGDSSENMIEMAKSLHPDIAFRVAHAENLPFDDESFDTVVINYTAYHFARPDIAFKEVKRALKPAGRVVVIEPCESPSWRSFTEARDEVLPPERTPGGPVNATDPQGYVDLLKSCGYEKVSFETRPKPLALESIEVLIDAGWSMAGLAEQPHDVQARIRSGTIRRAARYRQPDGSYEFPEVVIAGRGFKSA